MANKQEVLKQEPRDPTRNDYGSDHINGDTTLSEDRIEDILASYSKKRKQKKNKILHGGK